jgi:hypothetical protein
MGEIKINELNMTYKGEKVKVLRKAEFAEQYCNGVTNQALDYAIIKDLIDWTKLENSRETLIVLTRNTLTYEPRKEGGTTRMETSIS